jgi:hypothetical protein
VQSDLIYHYTALRSQKRWKSFKEALHSEYLSRVPEGEKLLIIGGSAASCLSADFLKKFKEICIYDKDPLAPLFFRWFHGSAFNKKYFIEDAFSFDGIKLDANRTAQIIKLQNPDFILFSNVIVQLPIYYKSFFKHSKYIDWAAQLQEYLSIHRWMSFHDIFSLPKSKAQLPEFLEIEKNDTIVTLSERYNLPQMLVDHLVLEQKWPHTKKCLRWDLYSNATHYVGIAMNLHM